MRNFCSKNPSTILKLFLISKYTNPNNMKQMLRVFCLFLTITISSSVIAQTASSVPEKPKSFSTLPEVPQGYMCTKVELAPTASPEMKKSFMEKNNGQTFIYRFTNAAGIEVAKEEVERLVKEESMAKQAEANKLTNPKR
jgi:hypothetical protein